MAFTLPDDLAPELYPLAWLAGTWRGYGILTYGEIVPEQAVYQEMTFDHDGGPYLRQTTTIWTVDATRSKNLDFEMPGLQGASLLAPALAYARCDAPALAVAAALSAHFRFRRVFEPASCAVGAGVARWILVTRGVDPTGVCVPGAYDAVDPARAGRALAGWVSADEAGLARWIAHYCAGVVYGARVGRDVARHVQAGRLA